jgi:hypothetical protein
MGDAGGSKRAACRRYSRAFVKRAKRAGVPACASSCSRLIVMAALDDIELLLFAFA